MVTTKAALIAIAALLAVACIGISLFISDRQTARKRADEFFSTTKEFPTSGGQKMKPEW